MVLTKNTQNMLIIWMLSSMTVGANFAYVMVAELKTYSELIGVTLATIILISCFALSTNIIFKDLGKYEKVKQVDGAIQSEQQLKKQD